MDKNISRKFSWKYHLQNGNDFVQASICEYRNSTLTCEATEQEHRDQGLIQYKDGVLPV